MATKEKYQKCKGMSTFKLNDPLATKEKHQKSIEAAKEKKARRTSALIHLWGGGHRGS
jgi:hypothetical protein